MLDELGPGEVGFFTAAHQAGRRYPRRRHHHRREEPDGRGAAGLQAGAAGGVLRPVPGRRRRLRGPARGHGQAAPQRRQLLLRDGDLGGAGLRLPLRLPRPPAPRDHHRAARARVQPRPDHDRAVRHLPYPHERRLDDRDAQPGRHAGRGEDRPHRGAVDRGDHPRAGRISRRRAEALPGPARPAEEPHLRRHPRHARLRAAAQRGGVRLLRPAEIGLARLCLVRLPDHRLRGGRPRQAVDPGQRRAGRCAVDHRAPRARRKRAAAPCARS